MGKKSEAIAEALFSRTQQQVLGLLFSQPERRFTLGEIVRAANKGTGAVYRELARLTAAGLVTLLPVGGKKLYQANRASLVFDELVGLMAKLSSAAPQGTKWAGRIARTPLREPSLLRFAASTTCAG